MTLPITFAPAESPFSQGIIFAPTYVSAGHGAIVPLQVLTHRGYRALPALSQRTGNLDTKNDAACVLPCHTVTPLTCATMRAVRASTDNDYSPVAVIFVTPPQVS